MESVLEHHSDVNNPKVMKAVLAVCEVSGLSFVVGQLDAIIDVNCEVREI
jgi:hypothetical protein